MENWIGIAVWIVMGGLIALVVKGLVSNPDETPGHTSILIVLGAFAAVVGGMLGVGIFEFRNPEAVSAGGLAGAAVLAGFFSWIYRWGIRRLI